MIESTKTVLRQWNNTHDDRTKLQHSYVAGAAAVLVIAGVIGLFEYRLGQSLLLVALGLIVLFAVNAVVWALLQSFVLMKLKLLERPAKKK